ncbi:hypothetical protein [Tissierella praeacuta]|uniref:hypothetical protein n=1 Tax=Tissierella praeacuta TaxID=43131 RepID=UPI00333E3AD2
MCTKLIRDTIAGIEPTEGKVDEICEKLLIEKRELEISEKRKGNPGRLKKLLPLVAVFTIIISTTALAYTGVDFSFLKYLNEKNIVNESLIGDIGVDDYIYNIDKEIANKNGILHIKQVIMDEDTIFLYMSFEGKEDIDFTGKNRYYSFKGDVYNKQWFSEDEVERKKLMDEYAESEIEVVEKGSAVYIDGIELRIMKGNPRIIKVDKNKMGLVFSYNMREYLEEFEGFIGSKMTFCFKDLGYYKTYPMTSDDGKDINVISDRFVPLVKGNWEGNIKLDGKLLPTKTYKIDEEIDYSIKDGTEVKIKITDIGISNFSLKINVECEKNEDVDIVTQLIFEHTDQQSKIDGNVVRSGDIKLKHKNDKITQAVTNIILSYSEDGRITVERSFDSPINLEELKSIIIWGKEIKLK